MKHPTFNIVRFVLGAICSLVVTGAAAGSATGATDRQLLKAVRGDDTRAVRALLKAGADRNTRDDIGATALMVAAAFGSPACMRILLDGGAGVNASSNGGATALMWATAWAAMAWAYTLQ